METSSPILLTFLLNAVWQVPLPALIAMLAGRLLRDGPASQRHAVWVAALVAAVALPLASIRPHPRAAPMQVAVAYAPAPAADAAPPPASVSPRPTAPAPDRRTVPFPQTAATLIWAAYLAFLAVQLARFGYACLRTLQLRRDADPRSLPPNLEPVWARCREAFSLQGVELRCSARVSGPATIGALRRTVILPHALLAETSGNILTSAIGHEMAHIARHDFALSLVYELLYVPISFHPAARLIRRQIERTREMACDELVTRRLLDPGVYAESIVGMAARMTGRWRSGYSLGVFDGDALEDRVRRLLRRPAANLKRARLSFAAGLSALAACAVIASGLALTARAQSQSQTEMKLAGDAYNRGDFKTAVEHFENAVRLEPTAIAPKLFLSNALLREFFAEQAQPGSPLLAAARRQYRDVLAYDPRNRQALHGMMAVAMDAKELKEAREWALKLVQSDPNDKTACYTAAVVDWATVFPEFQREKQAAGGKPQDYFVADPGLRKRLRDQYLDQVEDGFHMLEAALRLDPQYDEAMAYMNLLYRLKAGLADNPAESANLLAQADQWVGKAIAAKRAHPPAGPEPQPQLDVNGPPPGPAGARVIVSAPPPPPPPPARLIASEKRVAASAPPAAENQVALPGHYWQVTGAGEMLAADLFRQLRGKGFPAMMHDSPVDHQVRVVAGPYFDRQSLDRARSALEDAGFRPVRKW